MFVQQCLEHHGRSRSVLSCQQKKGRLNHALPYVWHLGCGQWRISPTDHPLGPKTVLTHYKRLCLRQPSDGTGPIAAQATAALVVLEGDGEMLPGDSSDRLDSDLVRVSEK